MKKIFKKLSTFWQISLISFFVMMIIFLCTYIFQFFIIKSWLFNSEKKNMQLIYKQMEVLFNYNGVNLEKYMRTFDTLEISFAIYDENRNIKFSTGNISENLKDMKLLNKVQISFDKGIKKVILRGPINFKNNNFHICIEKKIGFYRNFLIKILVLMGFSIVVISITSLLVGMYILKRFANKLKFLKDTMKNIKEVGVSDRVKISNDGDEFEEVGIVFNSMMDEVEKSFNLQRQFVQDASHELRTPLTILKGHLQMLNRWGKHDKNILDKSLKIILDETERFIKLVNDLLTLTKIESYGKEDLIDTKVNVGEVVGEVIYGFNVLKDDVKINFEFEEGLMIKMSDEHLKQLVIIFIDNSIKYSKQIKNIWVKIYTDGENVFLSVRDNGIGIKHEDIERITDKFYRVDKLRKYNNGFGIGLSIASQLVKAYGGNLKITSEFGVFTEVVVSFKKA